MEIEKTENCIYVTMSYEAGEKYVGKNYDFESLYFEVEGGKHRIIDCLVSDNGESVILVLVN